MSEVPLHERTVGVVDRADGRVLAGPTLFSQGRETYLIDLDGRVLHSWRAQRNVFCARLRPNGNLLRDGSENVEAVSFRAGGASGYVEEVTWDNEPVWRFTALPYSATLTHHSVEPMPNGGALLLCWERKSRDEALAAGRRPELLPDGEVWNNLILEVAPDGRGGASVVWEWSMWDHLVQDYDPSRDNYGDVGASYGKFDINFCPPMGKPGCRNRDLLTKREGEPNPSGLTRYANADGSGGKTGEKDWLHANSATYDETRDLVTISLNVPSEVIVIDHALSTELARTAAGDIRCRLGNPATHRRGGAPEQAFFVQHSAHLLPSGNLLVFNNGRAPDRQWSSVEEFELEYDSDGNLVGDPIERAAGLGEPPPFVQRGAQRPVWSFGPRLGRRGSFYCTHIGACQRLKNGNTLVTLGPQAILIEVDVHGEEVWRYVSPCLSDGDAVAFVRQGDQRCHGKFSLFAAYRYADDYEAFAGRRLEPGRHLEA